MLCELSRLLEQNDGSLRAVATNNTKVACGADYWGTAVLGRGYNDIRDVHMRIRNGTEECQ